MRAKRSGAIAASADCSPIGDAKGFMRWEEAALRGCVRWNPGCPGPHLSALDIWSQSGPERPCGRSSARVLLWAEVATGPEHEERAVPPGGDRAANVRLARLVAESARARIRERRHRAPYQNIRKVFKRALQRAGIRIGD